MKLQELYEMQRELDEAILDRKARPMNKKELLAYTLLALQVEVSELANATRAFKHWSLKGPMKKDVILEEYSDVLHFFLSIGNQLGFSPEEIWNAYVEKRTINFQRQKDGY